MKTSLRMLLMMLLVCGLVTSCGSDESGGAPVATTTNDTKNASPTTSSGTGSTSFTDFKNKVIAGQFASMTSTAKDYVYNSCDVEESSWWIFDTSSVSCSSSFLRRYSAGQVDREDDANDSEAAAKAFLASIIQSASGAQGTYFKVSADGSSYQFQSGNKMYEIDLTFPAIANPVKSADLSISPYGYQYTGASYYMYYYLPSDRKN